MKKQFCKTIDGKEFCEEIKQKIWLKANSIIGKDSRKIRKDKYGNEIHFSKYGKIDHVNGWEIDHSKPKKEKGTDHLNNLQPLQWTENRKKGDIYPYTNEKRKVLLKNRT